MKGVKEFSYGRTLHSGILSTKGRENFDKIDWSDSKKSEKPKSETKG